MTALSAPFAFELHLFWWLTLAVVGAGYVLATGKHRHRGTTRQHVCFFGGLAVVALAVTWPLGDLAAHWSLLALVAQRLLLTLAAPPLLIVGTPATLLAALTRPAPFDAALRFFSKPVAAIVTVTVVAVATLTPAVVDAQSSSTVARFLISLLVLSSGFVLWSPVLTHLPGATQLSSFGRAGYLFVQSIVPSFPSLVWIFARRPLYPCYDHIGRVLGMSPVVNQQLSGFAAKLSTIAVLWTVAFVVVSRASDADEEVVADPLLWTDVQRELERAERRERRDGAVGPGPHDDVGGPVDPGDDSPP